MFANRRSAGRQLSARLQHLREEKPVVLALPSGGVPVGFEVAEGLDAPLDAAAGSHFQPGCNTEAFVEIRDRPDEIVMRQASLR